MYCPIRSWYQWNDFCVRRNKLILGLAHAEYRIPSWLVPILPASMPLRLTATTISLVQTNMRRFTIVKSSIPGYSSNTCSLTATVLHCPYTVHLLPVHTITKNNVYIPHATTTIIPHLNHCIMYSSSCIPTIRRQSRNGHLSKDEVREHQRYLFWRRTSRAPRFLYLIVKQSFYLHSV